MMIRRTVWIACLLLTAGWVCSGCGENQDQSDIRDCFNRYKSAILSADSAGAANEVNSGTIKYYDRMLNLALHGSRQEVQSLSIADRMMVYSVRHRVPLATAKQMTGKALFIHGVRESWVNKEAVQNQDLGKISVSGTTAKAEILIKGKLAPIQWTFHKEEGKWKMDLTSVLPAASQALSTMARRIGMTGEELALKGLEIASDKAVDESSIHKPMISP